MLYRSLGGGNDATKLPRNSLRGMSCRPSGVTESVVKELELWGGPECTVNRIGDDYKDQVRLSGHQNREADLDLFAGLGIAAIRYPLLWERVAPDLPDKSDWSWSDIRLGRLRELGIRTIAGLVHHGSGPRYTSLIAESFATGLA